MFTVLLLVHLFYQNTLFYRNNNAPSTLFECTTTEALKLSTQKINFFKNI